MLTNTTCESLSAYINVFAQIPACNDDRIYSLIYFKIVLFTVFISVNTRYFWVLCKEFSKFAIIFGERSKRAQLSIKNRISLAVKCSFDVS